MAVTRAVSITRDVVQSYLDEYEDRGEAIAALVADYPELENESRFHSRTAIEVIIEDLDSYRIDTVSYRSE